LNQKKTIPKALRNTSFFLGCHKKSLLMRRRWPFGFKGKLEMADHLCPTFGREIELIWGPPIVGLLHLFCWWQSRKHRELE